MILRLNKQFYDKAQNGLKKHTVRAKRPKKGANLHLVEVSKDENEQEIQDHVFQKKCTLIQDIRITRLVHPNTKEYRYEISVDDRILDYQESAWLAFNDGFLFVKDFVEFLWEIYPAKSGHTLNLNLIHWTDLKY